MRLPLQPTQPCTLGLIPVTQVLSGRVRAMNMDDAGFHKYDSRLVKEGHHNRLYLNIIVEGQGGQLTDTAGLAWVPQKLFHDTPERSEVQARYCIEVLKEIVRNGKPRDAVRHGILAMETAIMREGLSPAFPIPWA